ncbi:MAG: hypothetical protein QM754_14920 [Tepidisphaeraceae bacterium]
MPGDLVIARLAGFNADGHVVDDLDHRVVAQKPGDEHVRFRPVNLPAVHAVVQRRDFEVAALLVVENSAEDAGRIEVR